jgi:hypothetical protein
MEKIIHLIDDSYNTKFIIAKTKCGKDWDKINEFTSNDNCVTCKKCKDDSSKK